MVISDDGAGQGRYGYYGLYQGGAVARDNWRYMIVIYRDMLVRDFGHDPEALRRNVEIHEQEARVSAHDRLKVVRDCYGAYVSGDRSIVEQHLAEDFRFSAPPDVGIDRATYFERCWPSSETIEAFEYERLFEANDEVIVTYESTKTGGRRFRNTEIFGFEGDKISRVEVYFGWDVE